VPINRFIYFRPDCVTGQCEEAEEKKTSREDWEAEEKMLHGSGVAMSGEALGGLMTEGVEVGGNEVWESARFSWSRRRGKTFLPKNENKC
jgi:hypothetical protein